MYLLAKLLKALHSDAGPWQLALGIMFGMIMGITPLLRLHNLIILFIVLFFRVNLTSFLFSLGLFSILALALDPWMAGVGEAMLTNEGLQATWTSLYNSALGQLSQFHHTLTLGSLTVAMLFSPVLLVLSKILVVKYRKHFLDWVEKLWIIEVIKGSRVYQIYQGLGG